MISLLTGNGRVLLTINEQGSWEHLYYPYPGLHQQLREVRLGLFDHDTARLEWLDHEGDAPTLSYVEGTNVCQVEWSRPGLEVAAEDLVHPDRDMIVRRIRVRNTGERPRRLALFHYQSMQLAGSAHRETAYWDEARRGLHHYKRSYHLQFLGRPAFTAFSCGEHTLKGLTGTHVDAEDGRLMGNLVSHGAADSIGQWDLVLGPGDTQLVWLFVLIGRTREDVRALHASIQGRDPEIYRSESIAYWDRWIEDKRGAPSFDLSPQALEVYARSLYVMSNVASENGAIIASPDSMIVRDGGDGYEYCWWRDGAYIAMAMARVGMLRGARAFLDFAAHCQESNGSFLHRHFPDGKLGPTWHPLERIQIDQTASVVQAVHQLYRCTGDVEELHARWELVRRAADFMMEYTAEDHLPSPSYDLWEERFSQGAYATGMVIKGLDAACAVAKALGRRHDLWAKTARDMRRAAAARLWNKEKGCFRKAVDDDTIDASSLLVDLFAPGDARHFSLVEAVEQRLWQPGVGGVARYEGDRYFGKENPWIICTLWLARAHLGLGNLERCRELIEWAAQRAVAVGLLPEQVDAESGQRRGVVPLTWSHSTFVELVNEYSAAAGRRRAATKARVVPA